MPVLHILRVFTAFTLVGCFTFTYQTQVASACSCVGGGGITSSIPEDGASVIPLDTAIIVTTLYGADIELIDEAGNGIEFETIPVSEDWCGPVLELRPLSELLPNHTYTLVDKAFDNSLDISSTKQSVTFTTGSDVVGELVPPKPEIDVVTINAEKYGTTCGEARFLACLSGADDAEQLMEIHVTKGARNTRRIGRLSELRAVHLYNAGDEACFTLFARDMAGNLSEPLDHCVTTSGLEPIPWDEWLWHHMLCDAAPVQSAESHDEQSAESHDGETDTQTSQGGSRAISPTPGDGCSIDARGHRAPGAALAALLGACALLLERRKSRQSR